MSRKVTDEQKKSMLEEFTNGLDVKDISKIYNFTISTINRQLRSMLSEENFIKINSLSNKKICYFVGTQHKAFLNINFKKGSNVLDPFRYIKNRDGVNIIEIGEGEKI